MPHPDQDHNQSIPPSDTNGSFVPVDGNQSVLPIDQNHSEYAPPSNPSIIDSNQTNLPHPDQDHNQSIPPSDTNGSLVPVDGNESIVPVDQNHSEHAPPSNPSIVESNQTNMPHPDQDHNQSIPPSDTNGSLVPVDGNQSIVPVDQNHSEHAPPSNPPLVDRNQTDSDIPATDQNETIEPLLPRVKLPQVITMTVVAEKSGLVRAVGRVANDGDEVPSKFGFAVSQQIPFEEDYSNVHFYEAKGSRFVFEVVITDLEPGNTYYFSSFAQNAGGTIFGSIKRLTINPQYAVPFGGVEIANEWYRSPWFGMFKGTNNNWVFHPELGWIYHSNDQTNGVWIWIENFGWSWTGADLWPYFWVNDRADWIYYLGIHEDIPRFWDYTQQSLIRW